MRPAGLNSLPLGYTRLYFLECTGTQRIATGYVPNNETGIYSEWCHTVKCNGHDFGVKETNSLMFINSRYSEVGSYGYGWGKWTALGYVYPGLYTTIYSEMNFLNCRRAKVRTSARANSFSLGQLGVTFTKGLYLFNGGYPSSGNTHRLIGRIYTAKISQGTEIVRDFMPMLDSNGRPCMFDTVTKKPFYNEVTTGADFTAGMTLDQAIKLKDLPAKTATLDISLPEGYEANEEVMESIRQAEEKGWTINRTTYTPV